MTRLAIVTTHPIQYYAPWFRALAARTDLCIRVFYLWRPEPTGVQDAGFAQRIEWDIPLLDGYDHEFVPNVASSPGTHHFNGINNPGLDEALRGWKSEAVLLMAYNFRGLIPFIFRWRDSPLLFRGDSHILIRDGSWKGRLRVLVRRLIFKRFAAVLYVGEANREYCLASGVPSNRLFYSPHAIDQARFAQAAQEASRRRSELLEQYKLPEDCILFLFAGKFQQKKRPDLLISAFRDMTITTPSRPIALIMAGSGPMESSLKSAASGIPNVYFRPFQNQTAMPGLLAAVDVMVLPSQGPGETWGLIVNEAQSVRCAVIVSDHVGCWPDLVAPRGNQQPGIVFPAGNQAALAEAMRKLVDDPTAIQRMGRDGLDRAKGYTYEAASKGLLEALDVVLKHGGKR